VTQWVWFWAAKAPAQPSFLVQMVPFLLIFVIFYFLIIRPQRKREREHQLLLNRLKKGDKVLTTSGFYGEVYSLSPETAVIEIAPKVKVTVQRGSIAGLVAPDKFPATSSSSSWSEEEKSSSDSKKKKKSLKKKKK